MPEKAAELLSAWPKTGARDVMVGLVELIEPLDRFTKMKLAPAGARSAGLKAGAFVPVVGGMRVEMPGGSHFVWITDEKLNEEVTFDVKPIPSVLRVLRSHAGKQENVGITVESKTITLRCGGTKFSFPRRP